MTRKKAVTFSLDEDTIQMLKLLARDSHKNATQWITDKVWETYEKEKLKTLYLRINKFCVENGIAVDEFLEKMFGEQSAKEAFVEKVLDKMKGDIE